MGKDGADEEGLRGRDGCPEGGSAGQQGLEFGRGEHRIGRQAVIEQSADRSVGLGNEADQPA